MFILKLNLGGAGDVTYMCSSNISTGSCVYNKGRLLVAICVCVFMEHMSIYVFLNRACMHSGTVHFLD